MNILEKEMNKRLKIGNIVSMAIYIYCSIYWIDMFTPKILSWWAMGIQMRICLFGILFLALVFLISFKFLLNMLLYYIFGIHKINRQMDDYKRNLHIYYSDEDDSSTWD